MQPWVEKSRLMKSGIDDLTKVDVTEFVQWSFNKSGLGRKSYRRLTGLEARVFMRGDARVVIDPKRGPFGQLLQETAEEALVDTVGDVAERAWAEHASSWWLVQGINP